MSFYESPRFPDDISYGAVGGPGYSTDIVVVNSGNESRNINWALPLGAWDVSHGIKNQAHLDVLIAFFRVVKGRGHGFRFKDWMDYRATAAEGVFVQLTSTTFQMQKKYTAGSNTELRTITKPVSGTITITGGSGASLATSTGIVTVASGTPTAWSGQFDVPCRFDTDRMRATMEGPGGYSWDSIPIVEIRL